MTAFAARAALVCSVTVALFAASSSSAPAQQKPDPRYTVLSGSGETLYRIAIAPVIDKGGAASAARQATKVLTRDLTLCGMFKVLDPKGFLANLSKEGVGIDPTPWQNVGAQGVIKARVQPFGGRRFTIDFFLYDTTKGVRPQLAKSYKSRGVSVRRLAHRFGNAVVKYFTGEPGIFLTKIAFATGRRGSKRSQIYVIDYDGYGVHRVSHTGPQSVLPAWSPDGTIAYTSFLWRNADLYITHGGRGYRISKRQGLNTGAAYSPSGSQIALTLSKDGNAEIYVISPHGKIIRRVTHNPGIDTSPTWSPDGSQIAFVSNRAGTPQIWVIGSHGGGARRLTFQGSYNQEPAWCPKKGSNLIAFTARDKGGNYDIFTIDAKKGTLKRLTQGQGSNRSATWAPNGRLIAFERSGQGIWLMDSGGYNQHKIYPGGSTPAWSRR